VQARNKAQATKLFHLDIIQAPRRQPAALRHYDMSLANSYFKPPPVTETIRDNAFPIGSY
jgi:hypothetical protein